MNRLNPVLQLSFVLLLAGSLGFYACQKTGSGNDAAAGNKITMYLTDHQSLIFDKVFLQITKVEVKVEDDGVDSLGGWFTLNSTPGIYDILRFRNGIDTLFASGQIPANRKLRKLRLTLGTQNSVVIGTQTSPLLLHNNKNFVIIKLEDDMLEQSGPGQFRFWLDVDMGTTIRHENGNYVLRPGVKVFNPSQSGRLEGKILPNAAGALVLAIKGSDTSTARPENNGDFKIVGLPAGTYKVWIDATANNYKDSVLNNITIRHSEDTKLGTITLRQ